MDCKILSLDTVKEIMHDELVANFQFYIDAALNELRPSLLVYNPISATVDPFATGEVAVKALKGFFDAYPSVEGCAIQLVQQNAGRKPIWGAIPYLNAEVFIVSNADAKKQFAVSFPITDIVCEEKKLKEKLLAATGSLYTTNNLFTFLSETIYRSVAQDSKVCVRRIYEVLFALDQHQASDEDAIKYAKKNGITLFDYEDTTAVEISTRVPRTVLIKKSEEVVA